jgi:superfamily II DNA/RNA helicase
MTSTPTFTDLGVPADLADELGRQGITAPFPIQAATIADAIAGRDVSGRAPTGSGKTLAFCLPTVVRVGRSEPRRPQALVLTPTRELAAQVRDAVLPLAKRRRRWVATVYGGTNLNRDIKGLARGVDILVATPGRLADLIQQGACDLSDVRIAVLDEADRMADMGFLPEVRRLLDQTHPERQTLLFSATLDGDVDVLVRNYQRDPVRHEMAEAVEAPGEVDHHFWSAMRETRRRQTADIVSRVSPAIVFTRTKRGADRLARQLGKDGIATAAIHGDRSQNQRERALARFAAGDVTTLVATDVAARGIHVDDVGVVVHYDLAGSDKDYVHRSGRTGRAGARGVVVSLVLDDQHKDARAIQRSLDLPQGTTRMDLAALDGHGTPATTRPPKQARGGTDRPQEPAGGARHPERRRRRKQRGNQRRQRS